MAIAGLWFISSIMNIILEKQQFIKMAQEIEYYNKIMAERFKKNGRRK